MILRKTKTLNNFNINQNQIQYFVIILAIIKLVRQMCVGNLHVILNIETQTRYDLVFSTRLICYLTLFWG